MKQCGLAAIIVLALAGAWAMAADMAAGTGAAGADKSAGTAPSAAAPAAAAEPARTFPIQTVWEADKKLFAEIRKRIVENAALKPLVLAESDESYFWTMGERVDQLMDAYNYSGDEALVETFVPLMEQILSQRYTHPTEPKVWSGWWHYQMPDAKEAAYYTLAHGAVLYYTPALKFVMAVRADAKLKAKYGEKAEQWFKDITEVEIPAWDKRGCWHDLGEKGGWYGRTTQYPDVIGDLKERKDLYQGASYPYSSVQPFMRSLALAYRLAGGSWYRIRMDKCERWFRAHWRTNATHAEWNYGDFAGPWDYQNGRDGPTKTAYLVHPKGEYYVTDVAAAVDCYDVGVCFTRTDIERLVQTNLEFMWLGDVRDPKFKHINGTFDAHGKYGKGFLWTPLGHFDPKARQLWKVLVERERGTYGWEALALGYLLETARPVSWEPRYKEEIPVRR